MKISNNETEKGLVAEIAPRLYRRFCARYYARPQSYNRYSTYDLFKSQRQLELMQEIRMTNSRTQSIAVSITDKYGMGECQSCASALAAELTKSGITGKILRIEAIGSRPYIVMKDVNFELPWLGSKGFSITHNGFHYGVLVGNEVFDNIHRNGVSQEKWIDSFTCDGEQFKLEIFQEF